MRTKRSAWAPVVMGACMVFLTGCSGPRQVDSFSQSDEEAGSFDDSGASAVILLIDETVEISGDAALHKRRVVKKILKPDHPEDSTFNIRTDKYRQLLDVRVRAVRPDGTEIELSRDDATVVPDFAEYVLYSESQKHLLRIPQADAGTIIEIETKHKIKNLAFWEPAVFQRDIPVVKQRYTLISPDDLEFSVLGSGMPDTPKSRKQLGGGKVERVWERYNTPAFEAENMMPPETGFIPVLWFSAGGNLKLGTDLRLDTWEDVVAWYEELSKKSLERGSRLESMVATQGATAATDREKTENIFRWVQTSLRYVAVYLGLDGYRPHDTEDILEYRYGDCKDQAVVLATALRHAGIEAYLALVRTSDLGRIPNVLPSPGYFNHLIVQAIVEGDTTWLDPTCTSCSFGVLPSNDQGAVALIIRDGERQLTTLPSNAPRPNRWDTVTRVDIAPTGRARVTTTLTLDGYYSSFIRNRLTHREGRSKEEVASAFFAGYLEDARIENIKITGDEVTSDYVTMEMVCEVPEMIDADRTVSFVRAVLHPLDIDLPECAGRKFPVALGHPRIVSYDVTFMLPDGWTAPDVPASGRIEDGPLHYAYEWSTSGRTVRFTREWAIDRGTVPAEGCSDLRGRLESVARIESEKFLVKRE